MSLFAGVPGAVTDDAGVVHLGNPLAEQRALAEGRAIFPAENRRVITVSGEDRLAWLDSVTSQAIATLSPGVSTELLVLDPNGHIEHAASVIDDGATTWLIVDALAAPTLLAWLTRMRFRMRVELADASEDYVVIAGTPAGLTAIAPAASHGVELVWVDPWPEVAPGGWGYAIVDPHPGREREWAEAIVSRKEAASIAEAATRGEIALAGQLAAEALRIAAWRPRLSREVDERALPHETDWMRTAVHLSKGCYRGQETVAKVHNLGHPPRRMVALQLDGSDSVLPQPGAGVRLGEAVVGTVTSVAMHYEEGPIALAIVRRTTPTDATLVVDTDDGPIAATQEVIVPPEAGATAGVPRIPRLNRRARAT